MLLWISMICGLVAGTLGVIASRLQPEKAAQFRYMIFFTYGTAALMALMIFL